MATEVRLRRGTAAEHEVFAGAPAEVTVDTTNNTLRVHDGETLGGHETMPRGILPSPIVPDTGLWAAPDGSGYQAVDDEQMLNALGIPAGKPTADPATPITGSLLSGAMLAAGAIVEQGTNANGSYWRWENGLQVCVVQFTSVSTLVWTASNPSYSGDYSFSWPAVFSSNPYMVTASRDYQSRSTWVVNRAANTTQGTVVLSTMNPTTAGANPGFTAFAIGFWK